MEPVLGGKRYLNRRLARPPDILGEEGDITNVRAYWKAMSVFPFHSVPAPKYVLYSQGPKIFRLQQAFQLSMDVQIESTPRTISCVCKRFPDNYAVRLPLLYLMLGFVIKRILALSLCK